MANLGAFITIQADGYLSPGTPHADGTAHPIGGTRRTTNGTGSAQADQILLATYTISASGTQAFNTLAAGSLEDIYGNAIDLDEFKMLVIEITSGEAKLVKNATNGMAFFTANDEGIQLNASGGLRRVGFDFGPDGLDVTTNSKFDIIETSTSATATVNVFLCGAS